MAVRPDRAFASSWRRERLTVEERVARGKAARDQVPRSAHARLELGPDRPDPVALLEEQAATARPRARPDPLRADAGLAVHLLPGRRADHGGRPGGTPRSGVTVQLCGDAHLSNFGLFGTPERRMLFDINDFDETLPGPWEWDVKRLAASFEVMGRARGFSPRRSARRRDGRRARVPRRACARPPRWAPSSAWYDHLEVGDAARPGPPAGAAQSGCSKQEARAGGAASWPRRDTRDSVRVLTKRTGRGRRRAADRRRPAAHRARSRT